MNYRILTALVLVALIFTSFSLFLQSSSKNADIEQANVLGDAVLDYLELIDNRCRGARASEYDEIVVCLDEEIEKAKLDVSLEEDEYKNFNEKALTEGYVILINEGRKSLESKKFTLTKNHMTIDQGCVIPGSIDSGYSCRLNFNSSCEPGDVLEVTYDYERVYLKTC